MSKTYTLYNKHLKKNLSHPKVGLWFTPDLKEAQEMLKACHEYVAVLSDGDMVGDFVIVDVETGEEVIV